MGYLEWIRLGILLVVIFLMYGLINSPINSTFWSGLGLVIVGLIVQYKLHRKPGHRTSKSKDHPF